MRLGVCGRKLDGRSGWIGNSVAWSKLSFCGCVRLDVLGWMAGWDCGMMVGFLCMAITDRSNFHVPGGLGGDGVGNMVIEYAVW